MTLRRGWCGPSRLVAVLFFIGTGLAASLFAQSANLPPKPDRYITDQAGILDSATVEEINRQLDQFERDTSNQIVVAIYPSLPPDAEIAQYATDTYHAWGVGQKEKDNGAILFVFVNDRKLFIATGRGLEGALPDATCKNIITQVITPAFRQGNYAAGIRNGVQAMLAATRGEYQGTGKTADDQQQGQGESGNNAPPWLIILIFLIVMIVVTVGRRSGFQSGPFIYTGGGWGGGGYGGFGGGGGGGGGGFTGGGGDSAGGGAGGSW
jgi:uncharacterized protein